MRKHILFFIFAFSMPYLLFASYACSSDKGGHDCAKCHKLTPPEALALLKGGLPADTKIIEIKDGPVKGLWEIVFDIKNRKGILYIDFSKKIIISGGEVFNVATKTNLTQERLRDLNKIDVAQIPLDEALVMGDKNAPKKVIVFTDPD